VYVCVFAVRTMFISQQTEGCPLLWQDRDVRESMHISTSPFLTLVKSGLVPFLSASRRRCHVV
jgi:hypothetical protein